jgi:hypothetical protein
MIRTGGAIVGDSQGVRAGAHDSPVPVPLDTEPFERERADVVLNVAFAPARGDKPHAFDRFQQRFGFLFRPPAALRGAPVRLLSFG